MSTATELMRLVVHEITAYGQVTYKTLEQIENFLAAEPEAEYDLSEVIPLTHRKAKGIITDGFSVTGFVLTGRYGTKCVVDMSAVRWFEHKGFFEMMHPVEISPTAEPARKPLTDDLIMNLAKAKDFDRIETWAFCDGVRFAEKHHGILGGDDE